MELIGSPSLAHSRLAVYLFLILDFDDSFYRSFNESPYSSGERSSSARFPLGSHPRLVSPCVPGRETIESFIGVKKQQTRRGGIRMPSWLKRAWVL